MSPSYFNQHYWDLLIAMTEKEIKVRYKNAFFGFLWMILNPLFQMFVIGFIFRFVTRIPIDNYFVFLFAGLTAWNFFSYTVVKNTPMIINERSLIQKAKFGREIIVLSVVLSNAFHLLISILLFIPVLLFFKTLTFLSFFYIVLVLIWIIILVSGLSLFLSAMDVKYRDVNFIIQAVMPLWFYATPIVYTLDFIPSNLRFWFYLNPMTGVVELFHMALLSKSITDFNGLLLSIFFSLFITFIGIWVFKKESPYFVDWI